MQFIKILSARILFHISCVITHLCINDKLKLVRTNFTLQIGYINLSLVAVAYLRKYHEIFFMMQLIHFLKFYH